MHTFGVVIGGALLVAIVIAPFPFSILGKSSLSNLALCCTANGALTVAAAWWGDFSIDLELWWLGVDFDSTSAPERTQDVATGSKEYAEKLFFLMGEWG